MTGDRVFPDWIEDDYDGIRSSLSSPAAKSIDRFRSRYSRLQKEIQPLPSEVEMYEIYQISAERLQGYFPDAFSSLTHCCEYLVGFWLYRHAYKMNAYDDGLKYSLSAGNWLIAFTCLRNMFEEIAHYNFYLSRIERNVKKIDQLEKNETKRVRQGKRPSDKWIKDYISCDLEIIRNIEKALQGSDFDWASWIKQNLQGLHDEGLASQAFKQSESRKTHVNDCISHMEKGHNKPFSAYYDILSEMVHPNFGSNTLVIKTREKFNQTFGRVWMAGAIQEQEAACWFFEVASEPMAETLAVSTRNLSVAKNLYSAFQRRAEASSSALGHGLVKPNADRQKLN